MGNRFLVIAVVVAIALSKVGQGAPQYQIVDLGVPGRTAIGATINSEGTVVVTLAPEEPQVGPPLLGEAYLTNGVSARTSIGSLGGSAVSASRINDFGRVVGWAYADDPNQHSFLYDGAQLQDLEIDSTSGSIAIGINNHGEIVGLRSLATGAMAFHRDALGSVRDLGTLGGDSSQAYDINVLGQIVGASQNQAGHSEAFLSISTTLHGLGTLGGMTSSASSINDNSVIIGVSSTTSGAQHAALFSLDGPPVDLAPTWPQSGASSINNLNQIVGFVASIPDVERHASLFSLSGPPVLLEDLIPVNSGWTYLYAASDINDRGQIVGFGIFNNEPGTRAFLMTPIPEPTAIGMLTAAIFTLHALTHRRRGH